MLMPAMLDVRVLVPSASVVVLILMKIVHDDMHRQGRSQEHENDEDEETE